jgi:4a-hydroxytetrahydrobiopterin dehydratase
MARIVPDTELQETLQNLPEWTLVNGQLELSRKFESFPAAIRFVNQVADLAEAANHHPDIDIRWTTVNLALLTHSQKALTEKDIALAQKISSLLS